MARHMRRTRRDLRRQSYPYASPVFAAAAVFFFLGLLIALRTVLG